MSSDSAHVRTLSTLSGGYSLQEAAGQGGPLWTGPCGEGPNGGITQSLIARFLCCRERFRLYAIEGLRPVEEFNHKTYYGSAWHKCEESYVVGKPDGRVTPAALNWKGVLSQYAQETAGKYPTAVQQIEHWTEVLRWQFPAYIDCWSKHSSASPRVPLMREEAFDVPHRLPSGRIVRLRGRWDGVDIAEDGIWLLEHKCKGDIDELKIRRDLMWDLQVMFYLAAIEAWQDLDDIGVPVRFPDAVDNPIAGVVFNVVRRPLSGGKHTIKRRQGETSRQFYARLGELFREDPGYFFMRWSVGVSQVNIREFWRQTLDPVLESMCDWFEWITAKPDDNSFVRHGGTKCGPHWRTPHFYNPLAEGVPTEVDHHMRSGSTSGLRRVDNLFEELS